MHSKKNSNATHSTKHARSKTRTALMNQVIVKSNGITLLYLQDDKFRDRGQLWGLAQAFIINTQIAKILKNGLYVYVSPEQLKVSLLHTAKLLTTLK